VSKDVARAAAGWYPLPQAGGSRRQVGYWDGTEWTGAERRAGLDGSQPRDLAGRVAVILLGAGFVGTILLPVVFSVIGELSTIPAIVGTVATLIVLSATPVALIVSVAGLVRAQQLKFKSPASLIALILSILGTVFLALPIALFVTGVWVLPHI
jgi:hypothetical protein